MTVTFRAVGTWENGATGLIADEVVSIPAGTTAGDMMVLLASWKDFSITALVSGWTEITEFADGAVATGNGAGSMKVGAWYKEHSGSESDPTLDFSTTVNLLGEAVIISFQRSLGAWTTPTFGTAAWAVSAGPQTSGVTSGFVDVPSGGVVICLIGIRDDSATFTRPTTGIDDSGGTDDITWNGNYVEAPATHASTITGNDMACDAGYRLVTTGGAATAPNATITALTAAESGAILWVAFGDTGGGAPAANPPYRNPMIQLLAH
jgi:hypothetical protein